MTTGDIEQRLAALERAVESIEAGTSAAVILTVGLARRIAARAGLPEDELDRMISDLIGTFDREIEALPPGTICPSYETHRNVLEQARRLLSVAEDAEGAGAVH